MGPSRSHLHIQSAAFDIGSTDWQVGHNPHACMRLVHSEVASSEKRRRVQLITAAIDSKESVVTEAALQQLESGSGRVSSCGHKEVGGRGGPGRVPSRWDGGSDPGNHMGLR